MTKNLYILKTPDTTVTPPNSTVISMTKNLYVPKTPEHQGNTTKHHGTPRVVKTDGCLIETPGNTTMNSLFVLITFVVIKYF